MTPDRVESIREEWRSLTGRILELERERSDAQDRTRLLTALHKAFTQIIATRKPDDVIAQVLRAAFDPLGFSRAIYFAVSRERGIEARFQIDGSDVVEPSDLFADVDEGSAIFGVLRGDAREGIGLRGELSAPLVDVRGWYVMSALQSVEGTLGILYCDGHRSPRPREWEADLIRSLTTIGSASIVNNVLFTKTRELSIRDPLTGLLNRRAFSERLAAEMEFAVRHGRSLTYVLIDVDNFKNINDRYGHAHGDTVLKSLADTIVRSSRAQDVVGRFAGDEFVVLLVNVEPDLSRALVCRLSGDLQTAGLSCSLGAASFPRDAADATHLFAAADRALYATKAAGKDGYSFA